MESLFPSPPFDVLRTGYIRETTGNESDPAVHVSNVLILESDSGLND